jgi:hypothetical protein
MSVFHRGRQQGKGAEEYGALGERAQQDEQRHR